MRIRSGWGRLGPVGAVVLAWTWAVVGCGDSPLGRVTTPGVETDVTVAPPERDEPEVPPAPGGDPVVGDTVPLGDAGGSVTVSAVEADVNAGRLFAAGRGKEYFAAEVKGCSGPTERGLSFEPWYFILQMTDKTVYDPGLGIKRPELRGGEVPAGGCLAGWVTFAIPEDAEPAFVVYEGSRQVKWRVPPAEGPGAERPGASGR